MSGPGALLAYIEAQPGGQFDWQTFVRCLADEYRGVAGLFLHRFGEHQSGEFLESAYIGPQYLEIYKEYATKNPWLPFLWRRTLQTGDLILGRKLNPIHRTAKDFPEFDRCWMRPLNVRHGIGAVLFKDREVFPELAIAMAVLRATEELPYTDDEVAKFKTLIPMMVRQIKHHPALRAEGHGQNTPVLYYLSKNKRILVNDIAKIREVLSGIGISNPDDQELLARIVQAARDGDKARLAAVRQAWEASAPSAAPVLQLPDAVPEEQWYKNRPKGQSARAFFLEEGWPAPFIAAKVLALPDVGRLDPTAYKALYHTNEGVQLRPLLPTKPQLVDQELTHVERLNLDRLASAQRRRQRTQ